MTKDRGDIGVVDNVVDDEAGVAPLAFGHTETLCKGHLSSARCDTSIIDIGHLLVKLFAILYSTTAVKYMSRAACGITRIV